MVIPVVHCFDNKFVIPAAVAFYSMLEHADSAYFYNLYVLHDNITEENQQKLKETIRKFKNCNLTFVNVQEKWGEAVKNLFNQTRCQGHYSKEIYYKFLLPQLFPQYDKVILTDVDVVYEDDISEDFVEFNVDEDYYLAGVKGLHKKGCWLDDFFAGYDRKFAKEEIKKMLVWSGYLIYNLKRMRQDNLQQIFFDFAAFNTERIRQPEQDTINMVCYPQIKVLHPRAMVCSYQYDIWNGEDYDRDMYYSAADVERALRHPIQLHYACGAKPWNSLSCSKADKWLDVLKLTPFYYDFVYGLIGKVEQYSDGGLCPPR